MWYLITFAAGTIFGFTVATTTVLPKLHNKLDYIVSLIEKWITPAPPTTPTT